jgi:hypothetical protein
MFVHMSDYIIKFQLEHSLNIHTPYPTFISSTPSPMAPWVTEKFLAVLQGLEERYKLSKGSDRKEVIEEAVKDITASAEKDTVAIPPGLEKVLAPCHQHFVIDPHSAAESSCLVPEQSSESKAVKHFQQGQS